MDDRLAQLLVDWHNRHPLARRISIFDVHTIGVVALPFMRSGRPAAPIEPSFAPAAAASDATTLASDAQLAPEDSDAAPLPSARSKLNPITRLLALLRPGQAATAGWPLFSERFINRLSPRRVARFALAHGHTHPPGAPDWPHRSIEIDEDLMARIAGKTSGAWPMELYLMTAGIDAGPARTRVLMAYGTGRQLNVLGRRCLDPLRLGLALGVPALLVAAGAGLWGLSGPGDDAAQSPAAAASAPAATTASSAAPAASQAAVLPASAPAISMPAAVPASAPASAAEAAASAAIPFAPAPAGIPDIRPRLNPAGRAPSRSAEAASQPKVEARAEAPKAELKPEARPEGSKVVTKAEPPTPPAVAKPEPPPKGAAAAQSPAQALSAMGARAGVPATAAPGRQVALVGPASASQAQAEATLERMRGLLGQTVRDPGQLQGQVFQTQEGWRPAIWPFASREQAQLINATLIASGLRTRAVDF